MKVLLCLLLGYLLGCVSPAYFLSRRRGFDIRTKGSGNAGASNTAVLMGWRFGILVALADVSKGAGAVLAARALFPDLGGAGLIAGAACVLGHIFPFYLRFRGGKGFASYMGMALAFNWKTGLVLAAVAVVITVVSDYIAPATMATVILFPLHLLPGRTAPLPLWLLGAVALVVFWKHLENFRRIARGQEVGLRGVGSHPKV